MCGSFLPFHAVHGVFYEIAGFSASGQGEEKKNKGKQLNRRNPRAALAQRVRSESSVCDTQGS